MKAEIVVLVTTHVITPKDLAAAFTEWDRRYREEPERFQSEAVRLLRETPESYGEACAPHLLQILDEIRSTSPEAAGSSPASSAGSAESILTRNREAFEILARED